MIGTGKAVRFCIVLTMAVQLAVPWAASADGGPVPSDAELWSQLREGQQIAVVRTDQSDSVSVDLFISLHDASGESNKVTFFVPLGSRADRFEVREESSLAFDQAMTEDLDGRLRSEAQRAIGYRNSIHWALASGTLAINGGWSWPAWVVWAMVGCSATDGELAPEAEFDTPSSHIAIFGLDEDTDLDALIQAAGLPPEVILTLEQLRGQAVAVVKLRTQPLDSAAAPGNQGPSGQPGLHLSWRSQLVNSEGRAGYWYPLGTGRAWAHPIDLTRVYVVAQEGTDFDLRFPRLGRNRSGFESNGWWGTSQPRIAGASEPSYAIDEAVGSWGRIVRLTYTQANPSEDILVLPQSGVREDTAAALRRQSVQRTLQAITWLLAPLLAVGIWVVTWRYWMKRILGVRYRWRDGRLYRDALVWALVYPLSTAAALGLTALLGILSGGMLIVLGVPLVLVTLWGLAAVFLFLRFRGRRFGAKDSKALLAYAAVVLSSNVAYLAFAFAYSILVGAA